MSAGFEEETVEDSCIVGFDNMLAVDLRRRCAFDEYLLRTNTC
jgi:hypothetical protein